MRERMHATQLLKWAIAILLYRSRALGLFHRLRNRHTLTVVVFHRVLRRDDPRTRTAFAEWTIGDEAFDACLAFFRRHFNLVSLDDVMAAAYGEGRLPHRSLLLTFDDGFADNLDYALPLLRKYKAPTVVFVSTDLIGRAERLWTEDLLWAARAGYLREADLQALYRLVTGHAPSAEGGSAAVVREIVRAGPSYALAAVESALGAPIDLKRISEPRQMLNREDIIELARHGVAIGAHGKTHTALDYAQDLTDELETPRATLRALLGRSARPGMDALACPHGVYTPGIVDRALATGYRLVFTTDGGLAALVKGRLRGSVIGRINVDGQRIAGNGRLRPERLAVTLFTQRHTPLAGQGSYAADAPRL